MSSGPSTTAPVQPGQPSCVAAMPRAEARAHEHHPNDDDPGARDLVPCEYEVSPPPDHHLSRLRSRPDSSKWTAGGEKGTTDGDGDEKETREGTLNEGRDEKADGSIDGDVPRSELAAPVDESEVSFPEGGLRAWSVVLGCWFSMSATFGYLNAFGIFQEYYSVTLLRDYSQSSIAWIGSTQYFFIFFVGSFAGRLFDMGYFRPFFAIGILCLVVAQMLLSLCKTYWQFFLCQSLLQGIGFGLVFNLTVPVTAHWFKRRRATAMGILASGSSTGGVVYPILLEKLIPRIGFPWTMRVVGFILFGSLIISWFTQRTRLPIRPRRRADGTEMGFWEGFIDLSAFRMGAYSFFCLGAFLVMEGLYTPFTYITIFGIAKGVDANTAFYLLSIINGASMFGRVIPGICADWMGRYNVLLPCIFVSGAMIFVWPACSTLGGLIGFSIVFGFTSGAYVSLIPACVGQLGDTSSVGARLGMMFALVGIAGLTGTPISGAILGDPANGGLHGDWWAIACFSAAVVVAGSICIFVSRYLCLGRKMWGIV